MVLMKKKAMMMMMMMMMVKVMAVVLFLMALSATVGAGGLDPNELQKAMEDDNNGGLSKKYDLIKSTTRACCNSCPCTKSIPPQCHCRDVGESCHSACKACACTRSIPPQCHCTDTTNFCYPPCSS